MWLETKLFPREAYPSGWEIDDMVWEYGAAVSAIVVDDNTVTLTLTPENRRRARTSSGGSVYPGLYCAERRTYVGGGGEVGFNADEGAEFKNRGDSRDDARRTARRASLVLAIHDPAEHAAAMLTRLLVERGVKIAGVARSMHVVEPIGAASRAVARRARVGAARRFREASEQNQPEFAHGDVLAGGGSKHGGVEHAEDLMKVPADFYAARGIAPGDVIQTDGSGLSRQRSGHAESRRDAA